MTTEDFTTLPEGFVVVLEGTVARCPRCGRNGVVKRPDEGTPYCIHVEESTLLCDGMRTEPTDLCDLPDA
jgi:C4-type Zn-finger protein